MNDRALYIIILVSVLALMVVIIGLAHILGFPHIESPEKRAGRLGERYVRNIIQEILKDDDILLSNVQIRADEKSTELDNVIINSNGMYIIEVKNYSGELFGTEEDQEWIKNTISGSGNVYQKVVKNPIKQVKRQIYILSRLLKENDMDVWIEGYVFFVEMNSPVASSYVLRTQKDIDNAIHHGTNNDLSYTVQEQLKQLLTNQSLIV